MSADKSVTKSITRDLSLPDWGPYAKDHFGVAHIANPDLGRLLECLIIPGIHAGHLVFPDKRDAWPFIPVAASPDLSYFHLRCLIGPGLEADIEIGGDATNHRLMQVTFSNATKREIPFRLDFCLGLQREEDRVEYRPHDGELFLAAHRYEKLNRSLPATAIDQCREGTTASRLFVERLALSPAFTASAGARAEYRLPTVPPTGVRHLALRYRLTGTKEVRLRIELADSEQMVALLPAGHHRPDTPLSLAWIDLPNDRHHRAGDTLAVEINTPSSDGDLFIDGFFLVDPTAAQTLAERLGAHLFSPKLERWSNNDCFALSSPLLDGRWYGVAADAPASFHLWSLRADDPAAAYRRFGATSRYWTRDRVIDDGNEHLTGDLRPLFCAVGETLRVRAVIGFDRDPRQLAGKLRQTLAESGPDPLAPWREKRFRAAKPEQAQSIESVMAATFTTICYPQDCLDEWIRHFSPGAFFPTLYLWDAGMQSLGLLECAPRLALENLTAYFDAMHDPRGAVLHGTVLPVHLFALWEWYQKTSDTETARSIYPRARRFYRFMAGKDGSLTDRFGSGLLCPWAYFYNSAGWDDYPAQAHVADRGMGDRVSPVANTAYTIRAAKLMALLAEETGHGADAGEYLAEARRMEEALLRHAWDEDSGWFCYVINQGKEPLRDENGVQFNRGLDGATPLVAGLENRAAREHLLNHCRDPQALWTDIGLSTVDQSAPYYSDAGYWNGSVWIAHQWFFFKAFLDCGDAETARQLARNVVEGWRRAVAGHRGQTFEAVNIRTRRGIGTPHFSALSVPVVTLYRNILEGPRLTAGFDTRVSGVSWNAEDRRLSARVSNPLRPGLAGFLAVMDQPGRWRVRIGSQDPMVVSTDADGCAAFSARVPPTETELAISPALSAMSKTARPSWS